MKVSFSPQLSYNLIENWQKARNSFCVGYEEEGVYKVKSAWFICRDYFSDLVYHNKTGNNAHSYGFNPDRYDWDGKGIVVYLGGDRSGILKQLDITNEFLKSRELPMLNLKPVTTVSGGRKCAEVSAECGWETDTKEAHSLYYSEVPVWYTKSTFRLYMWSSFIRCLWWQAAYGLEIFTPETVYKMAAKSSEAQHLLLMTEEYWDRIGPIIKANPRNVLQCPDECNGLDYEYGYGECEIEEYVHDSGGVNGVTSMMVSYGMVDSMHMSTWPSTPSRTTPYEYANCDMMRELNQVICDVKLGTEAIEAA